MAGDGATDMTSNPWAEYGLNPDGTPMVATKAADAGSGATKATPAPPPEVAALTEKIAGLEAKLATIPQNFEGLTKQLALVDKLVKAVAGDDEAGNEARYRQVYADLKTITQKVAPGMHKALLALEADPNALDKLAGSVNALAVDRLTALNTQAHARVMDLAKKAGFKAANDAELAEMVFPFEQTMTAMIGSSEPLRNAFVGGNTKVVDDLFARLVKPHVAARLRAAQARVSGREGPIAPPRGGAQPGATDEANRPKRDLATPKGRQEFLSGAVSRWLDKRRDEE